MNNILKQFVAWGTSLKESSFERAALRLTALYVAGIGIILLVSSAAIYTFSTAALDGTAREVESSESETEDSFAEEAAHEFGEHLVDILVMVDTSILVIASIISYGLARQTLWPIETLYKKQEQFIGDVAHELRTPLAVLKAGSQAVLRRERPVAEYVAFLHELEEEVDRLTRLSNELLFLIKSQAGHLESLVPVPLSRIVAQQVLNFQAYAAEHPVTMTVENTDDIWIQGVSDYVVRILQNLIKNALDYNHPNGNVAISVSVQSHLVTLVVKDTGIGISEKDQKRIFERFYKADSARTQSGAGLGLALVQELVQKQQGSISLSSVPGQGTTVTVQFNASSSPS